jgi:hypothetical protein
MGVPALRGARDVNKVRLSAPTVGSAFNHLARLGIVGEVTGKCRDHLLAHAHYVAILVEGVESIW